MAHILVVDDEETLRYAFETLLADEGHTVSTAGSYEEALQKIGAADFDLTFADIILGDKTGMEVLRTVRERNSNCPVVMITGYPNLETASEAVRLGAFDYIPKPVREHTLMEVTKRALNHKAFLENRERDRSHLEAILRSVKEAIITVNSGLVVTAVNAAAADICAITKEHVGKPFAAVSGCSCETCIRLLETTVREGTASEAQRHECRPESGAKCVVSLAASPLLDAEGVLYGAVLVVKNESGPDIRAEKPGSRVRFHNIIGKSEKMLRVFTLLEDLANLRTTVLISGETGTGKELVASALHRLGSRGNKPFVKINCSALPETLLESELFGHVRGAFTGAFQNKIGRFEKANEGTLFLDEIGDISAGVQLRLLRVLQEKEFEKVGDATPVKVDVRVIAATNKDLREKVRRGEFRDDLYYRLKVVEIPLPPLRERREEIPLLVDHFLREFRKTMGKGITAVSDDVQKLFMEYAWPGNIRELQHVLEHAFILCNQQVITSCDLPPELRPGFGGRSRSETGAQNRDLIIAALKQTDRNKAKAARLLGISRQTIYRKIEEYRI